MIPQNLAHVHLILNHVPLIGFAFGVLLLTVSHLWKSSDVLKAAQLIIFVSALLTIAVYFTGDPAHEVVFTVPGVANAAVEEHEESAFFALISVEICGLLALAGLVLGRGNRVPHKPLSIATFVLCLWALSVVARTNFLGGHIHHPETRAGFSAAGGGDAEHEKEEREDH